MAQVLCFSLSASKSTLVLNTVVRLTERTIANSPWRRSLNTKALGMFTFYEKRKNTRWARHSMTMRHLLIFVVVWLNVSHRLPWNIMHSSNFTPLQNKKKWKNCGPSKCNYLLHDLCNLFKLLHSFCFIMILCAPGNFTLLVTPYSCEWIYEGIPIYSN